ncbi:hypothetical protein [Mycolicibacterium mageritense]|uniref:hypothetical protein n=1 Tax=Mycolicibacterium mageritense TaxID=53462 RepID=UPI001E5B1358|nr:hypothetical protein [Mycolicibacterium mageritense]MCC9184140.1 hypothetical protein [Mycolicibacterium mageritense]
MRYITDVFTLALGRRPSEFVNGGALGSAEIESLRAVYHEWQRHEQVCTHSSSELWPLISHHDDQDGLVVLRNFPATARPTWNGQSKNVRDELATHLVACNGVVLADPLRRIFFDVDDRPVLHPRSEDLHRVAARLGTIEPLIDSEVVKVSPIHPSLHTAERQSWIEPFNLGPGLKVITDLIEEGYWISDRPPVEQRLYPEKVRQFLSSCGVRGSDLPTADPLAAVEAFARALMEVSWQLANAIRSGADLYLTSRLERRLFEVLIEDCADQLRHHTRLTEGPEAQGEHLGMLATVGLPLLNASAITFDDVVDIRTGDAFTAWRTNLNRALNSYSIALDAGRSPVSAREHFATELRSAASELTAKAKDKSLRRACSIGLGTLGIGASTSAAAQLLAHSPTAAIAVAGAASSTALTLMWNFYRQRLTPDKKAAVRFFAAFDL